MKIADLQSLCDDRLVTLLDNFGAYPTIDSLTSITVVAELIMALPQLKATGVARTRLAMAALKWLRDGLLADISVTRAEFVYPVALLTHLASGAPGYRVEDSRIIAELLASRMIGASELPTFTRQLMNRYFVLSGHPVSETREELTRDMIEKRVLRRRTDEFDLMALCIVGQLCMTRAIEMHAIPTLFPTIFLMEAMRTSDLNWLPPITALGKHVFEVDSHLINLATCQVATSLTGQTDLLPPPRSSSLKNDLREQAMTGLRLRSSIACCALLEQGADAAIC